MARAKKSKSAVVFSHHEEAEFILGGSIEMTQGRPIHMQDIPRKIIGDVRATALYEDGSGCLLIIGDLIIDGRVDAPELHLEVHGKVQVKGDIAVRTLEVGGSGGVTCGGRVTCKDGSLISVGDVKIEGRLEVDDAICVETGNLTARGGIYGTQQL